jgi:hypothetical protein
MSRHVLFFLLSLDDKRHVCPDALLEGKYDEALCLPPPFSILSSPVSTITS